MTFNKYEAEMSCYWQGGLFRQRCFFQNFGKSSAIVYSLINLNEKTVHLHEFPNEKMEKTLLRRVSEEQGEGKLAEAEIFNEIGKRYILLGVGPI